MSTGIPKGPDMVHPTVPGAIGSRNSTAQEGRDKVAEAKLIIEDAVETLGNLPSPKKPVKPA